MSLEDSCAFFNQPTLQELGSFASRMKFVFKEIVVSQLAEHLKFYVNIGFCTTDIATIPASLHILHQHRF
jgi:hypothetical protein